MVGWLPQVSRHEQRKIKRQNDFVEFRSAKKRSVNYNWLIPYVFLFLLERSLSKFNMAAIPDFEQEQVLCDNFAGEISDLSGSRVDNPGVMMILKG